MTTYIPMRDLHCLQPLFHPVVMLSGSSMDGIHHVVVCLCSLWIPAEILYLLCTGQSLVCSTDTVYTHSILYSEVHLTDLSRFKACFCPAIISASVLSFRCRCYHTCRSATRPNLSVLSTMQLLYHPAFGLGHLHLSPVPQVLDRSLTMTALCCRTSTQNLHHQWNLNQSFWLHLPLPPSQGYECLADLPWIYGKLESPLSTRWLWWHWLQMIPENLAHPVPILHPCLPYMTSTYYWYLCHMMTTPPCIYISTHSISAILPSASVSLLFCLSYLTNLEPKHHTCSSSKLSNALLEFSFHATSTPSQPSDITWLDSQIEIVQLR